MALHRTIGAVVLLSALTVTGCETPVSPGADPAPTLDPSPVAPEPTAGELPERAEPTPLFALGCDDVIPRDRVREMYGTELVLIDTQTVGVSPALLQMSAALADGALRCQWAPAGEQVATVAFTASVATPDEYAVAYEGYDLLPYAAPPLPVLDGARSECSDYYPAGSRVLQCGWSVFFDGVWIVAHFSDLPAGEVIEPATRENPDTSGNPITANPAGLSAKILTDAASLLAEQSLQRSAASDTVFSCEQLGTISPSESVFGTPTSLTDTGTLEAEDVGSTTAWMGGALTVLGVQRQDWTDCLFVYPTEPWVYVSVTYAP